MKRSGEKTCLICNKHQLLMFKYQGYYYHRCRVWGLVSTYPFRTALSWKRTIRESSTTVTITFFVNVLTSTFVSTIDLFRSLTVDWSLAS